MKETDLRDLPQNAAILRLIYEIAAFRTTGEKVIKVIHGEKLSPVIRREIRRMRREGRVSFLIPGETFGSEETVTQYLLNKFPEPEGDADMNAKNPTLTVVGLP